MKEGRLFKDFFAAHKRVLIKIIPHHRASIYKLELTHRHLALAVICSLLALGAFLGEQIAAVRTAQARVLQLEVVNAQQQHELGTFSQQTHRIWSRLQNLQHENQKIRQLTQTPLSRLLQHGQTAVTSAPRASAKANGKLMSAIIQATPWERFTAWIGDQGSARITFASETAQLTVLDVELEAAMADSAALRTQASAVADARREAALAHQRVLDAIPSLWPTDGYVSSGFGYRSYPDSGFHNGLDIVNDWGAPVYATGAGIVTEAGYDGGWGYKIVIDHGNGFTTWYAHNSSMLVGSGQQVRKGQLIARVGATGFATGPHVHYALLQWGRPINPEPYLGADPEVTAHRLALATP